MNVKLVLFDLDGVLLDTERINVISKITEAKKYGYTLTPDIVIGGFGMCFEAGEKYYKNIYGNEFPYDKVRHVRFDYIFKEMKEHGLPLKPGVNELLDYLEENHIKKGIVTSSPLSYIEAYKTINHKFFDRFNFFITHDDIKHGKPNPDCYLAGLTKGHEDKDVTLVVEDSKSGVLAGVNAGIKTIFVEDLLEADNEIKSKAFRCYKHINQIKELINGND